MLSTETLLLHVSGTAQGENRAVLVRLANILEQ